MYPARWIVGSLLCLFAAYVACCNFAALILSSRNRSRGVQRHYSQGPIVGPVAGYLGLFALPVAKPLGLWLLPLIDPSTWIMLMGLPGLVRVLRE